MFIVFLLIALAFVDRLFSYLGTHDSTQALPEGKKLVRMRQFRVVGALCIFLASVSAINSYLDRKHSEATETAVEQRKADWERRMEALLAEKCSRLAEKQCLDEIRKRRTEPSRSAPQGRASASPGSDAPFLRPWYSGNVLTNPFSRPLNPPMDLAPAEPKHYSASLGETLSSDDNIRTSSGHMGVYPGTALPGGPCVTAECTDIIADSSH